MKLTSWWIEWMRCHGKVYMKSTSIMVHDFSHISGPPHALWEKTHFEQRYIVCFSLQDGLIIHDLTN